jgi:hypothetical protein
MPRMGYHNKSVWKRLLPSALAGMAMLCGCREYPTPTPDKVNPISRDRIAVGSKRSGIDPIFIVAGVHAHPQMDAPG